MWSSTSYRSFKHKAKKGVLQTIGMTEERQEDSVFQAVLFSVVQFKTQIKDIHFKVHGLANAGIEYNNALEYLCGSGLKGEQLFNKEQKFVNCLKECLSKVLSAILDRDIPVMDELMLVYEAAKLEYDKTYFQTVKEMKKKDVPGADNEDDVVKYNEHAAETRKTWLTSKKAVVDHRNVLKGRLDNEVVKALEEVSDVSDADHHRLYCEYFKERILITSAMCTSGTVSSRNTAVPIKEILGVEDDTSDGGKQDKTVSVLTESEFHHVVEVRILDESNMEISDDELKEPPLSNNIMEMKSTQNLAVKKVPVSNNDLREPSPNVEQVSPAPPTCHEEGIAPPELVLPPPPTRKLPLAPHLSDRVVAESPPSRLPPQPPISQEE